MQQVMKIISIGEVLWDVVGADEHLGGAAFNFSAHMHRLGHQVYFVSGVGRDERGRRILERMRAMGLSTEAVAVVDQLSTGYVSVTLAAGGQPHFVIHRPAAYDAPRLDASLASLLSSPPPDWIYYGTLSALSPQVLEAIRSLIRANPSASRLYDINLRPASYTPDLVKELLSAASVVKLNDQEVAELSRILGLAPMPLRDFCVTLAARAGLKALCVTRGEQGSALWMEGDYVEASGYAVRVADAIGAGDAFAAAFLHGLNAGWPPARVADFANRVGALIASRSGAIPDWTVEEALGLGAT
jgi:fructokinase